MKRLTSLLKEIDNFGQGVNFTIAKKNTLNTWCGTLLTILIYTVLLFYGFAKAIKVKEYQDTIHWTTVKNDIAENTTFTFEEMGANFAVGFFPEKKYKEIIQNRENVLDYVNFYSFQAR